MRRHKIRRVSGVENGASCGRFFYTNTFTSTVSRGQDKHSLKPLGQDKPVPDLAAEGVSRFQINGRGRKKKPLVARPKTLVSMRRDSSDFSSNQFWPPSLDCFKWDNEAYHLQTFLKITITVMAIHFNSCNNFRAILTMLY